MNKTRSTYVPLTQEQIEEVRQRHNKGVIYDGDALDTIFDMAINCLLYGEEINRLRGVTRPEEVSTEKVRVVDSTDVPNLLCPDETPCTSPKECASQWRCGKRIPQNDQS